MNSTRTILAAVCLTVAAVALAPGAAPASHGYDQPITLHGGRTQGSFWTAYRVTTNGAGVSTHFRIDSPSIPAHLGALIYKGDQIYFGIVGVIVAGAQGLYAEINLPSNPPVRFDAKEPTPDYPWWDLAMNINGFGTPNPYAGELTFVWWIAGARNAGVRYSIEAEPGVALSGGRLCPSGEDCSYGPGWESGTETFVFAAHDFAGTARATGGVGAASARANVEGSRSVTIRRSLSSGFVAYGTHADVMTVDTPASRVQCPLNGCFLGSNGLPVAPGTYTFNVTGAGAGNSLTSFGEVVAGGADLILPPRAS